MPQILKTGVAGGAARYASHLPQSPARGRPATSACGRDSIAVAGPTDGGQINRLAGRGEHGDPYYGNRYESVFDRAEALGLAFVGPKHPHGGRQADPWPDELPANSTCVPGYYRTGQTPATATRQLDFVFASASIAGRVHATAVNDPADCGPSDHCRVLIDVDL